MSNNIKALRETQQNLVAEARTVLNDITDDTDESRAAELEATYDKIMAKHDKIGEQIERMERVEQAERALDSVVTDEPVENRSEKRTERLEDTPENRKAAFAKWLRFGVEDMPADQRSLLTRAQSTSTTAGGYTVPQGFLPEIVKSMAAWGPMLDPTVTRVLMTDSGNQMDIPTLDDTSNKGALLAENTQDSEQDVTFGQKQIDAYKYTSKVIRVSLELMQDSAFNVDSEIINPAFGERLGRIGNEHLTTGTGSSQPNGIVTGSSAGVTAAGATSIDFDDLISLVHSVDPAYRRAPTCRFQMNDSTLQALRKLKDGNSNYIWQPADARTGEPAQILGFPYSVNQDMASIGGSTKPVIFGDHMKYVVRMVRDFSMIRLVERYADFHQVGFIAIMRIDGEILDSAAIKHIVMESA